MKEVEVAKLDKEDVKMFLELGKDEEAVKIQLAQYRGRIEAMWNHLRIKYHLDYLTTHYIKNKTIYKQEA